MLFGRIVEGRRGGPRFVFEPEPNLAGGGSEADGQIRKNNRRPRMGGGNAEDHF